MQNQNQEKEKLEKLLKATKNKIQQMEQELQADEANAMVLITQLGQDLVEVGKGVCKGTYTLLKNDKQKEEESSISKKEAKSESGGGAAGSLATSAVEAAVTGDISIEDIGKALNVTPSDSKKEELE